MCKDREFFNPIQPKCKEGSTYHGIRIDDPTGSGLHQSGVPVTGHQSLVTGHQSPEFGIYLSLRTFNFYFWLLTSGFWL